MGADGLGRGLDGGNACGGEIDGGVEALFGEAAGIGGGEGPPLDPTAGRRGAEGGRGGAPKLIARCHPHGADDMSARAEDNDYQTKTETERGLRKEGAEPRRGRSETEARTRTGETWCMCSPRAR